MSECRRYIGIFEEAEWTGEKLLLVESDEPLEKLGMYIETDRKYMLLQLARVRDCQRVAWRRLQAEDSGSFETVCPCLSRPSCSFLMAAAATVGVVFDTPRPIADSTKHASIEMEPILQASYSSRYVE